jgi:hypothetical protein
MEYVKGCAGLNDTQASRVSFFEVKSIPVTRNHFSSPNMTTRR